MRHAFVSRVLLAAFVVLALTTAAKAHGIGTPRVVNKPAGPYLLSAWTDPDPLREDETHIVVGVTDAATNEPIVTGIEVAVTVTSADDPALSFTEIAAADSVNRLLYAVEFNDQLTAGRWLVSLRVSGAPGLGEGATFPIDVAPARGFNWLWLGIGGLAAIVLGWLVVALRGEKPGRAHRLSSRPSSR